MQFGLLGSDSIRIVNFQKTNAQKGELTGIKFYKVEYEAEIEFLREVWEDTAEKSREFIYPVSKEYATNKVYKPLMEICNETLENAKLYPGKEWDNLLTEEKTNLDLILRIPDGPLNKMQIRLLSEQDIVIYHPGERKKIKGTLFFNMTEKGWRGEDGNIY
jgi:hypothetical protein